MIQIILMRKHIIHFNCNRIIRHKLNLFIQLKNNDDKLPILIVIKLILIQIRIIINSIT